MDRMKEFVANGKAEHVTSGPKGRRFLIVVIIGLPLLICSFILFSSLVTSADETATSTLSSGQVVNSAFETQGADRLHSDEYMIEVSAEPISDTRVEFTVTTNAPLPVQAMADVTLSGGSDEETWIGEQKRVTLDRTTTVFVLDTTVNGKRLPSGRYDAEIAYYSRWGSDDNPAARYVPDLAASQEIWLNGSGETTEHARNGAALQRWVLGELDLSRVWSDAELRSRLGRFERYESQNAILSVIYYFPDADISLFIDPARGRIITYELGRVP